MADCTTLWRIAVRGLTCVAQLRDVFNAVATDREKAAGYMKGLSPIDLQKLVEFRGVTRIISGKKRNIEGIREF